MPDILIVGAGPVGLTMAAELARYGIGVRLIDRSLAATQTSKALVIWSRTLELMDRMGCTAPFLEAGLRARGATIRSGADVLGRLRFDHIASAYAFALMIPQRDTERLLADHLRRLGVEVERGVELVSFEAGADGALARLRHADGREEAVATPWLIGCDGAHSTVRHGLGLEFKGSAQGDDWLLADVRLDGGSVPPADEIATFLHRDGPFVFFPMPGRRARLVASLGPSQPSRPAPTLEDVQRLIDQRAGGGFTADDPAWLTNFRINERKVMQYRQGRVFLAGDAAHIHSPAGGQGMNTGMQDAINLAWKLALVARGEAGDIVLDSYGEERNAVGEMVLRNASLLTGMATLANPLAQAARNTALHFALGFPAVTARMASTMSETDIAYAGSPLASGAVGGKRWTPERYMGSPPGAGSAPRFTLYCDDDEAGAALCAGYSALLEAPARPAAEGGGIVIVRPDGYVGFSGDAGAWGDAAAYLESLLPQSAT